MNGYFCLLPLLALLLIQPLHAEIIKRPDAPKTIMDHDPTLPAVEMPAEGAEPEKEPVYILQSIIISPTRRLALINDNYVKVGDKIGEATVEAINQNTVILAWPGRKQTLYLFDQNSVEKNT